VTHEHVARKVQLLADVLALHLLAEFEHLFAVLGEMQVRTADSTRGHSDEHLAGAGYRLWYVVAQHHLTVAQYDGAH
jgi:hypothetical protein